MKILQVCSHFSINYPGGITKYVKTLSMHLRDNKHEVSIISGDANDQIDGIDFYMYKPKKIRAYPLGIVRNEPQYQNLLNYIKENNFDLIHIHASGDFPIEFYEDIAKLKLKYIVSLHDYYFICPRIFMVTKENDICHHVQIEKCASCVGFFESNDFVFRVSRKLNIKLPTISSNVTRQRTKIMRDFLANANLLLPVSNKVKEIFEEVCSDGNYLVRHIGNDTAYEDNVSRGSMSKKIYLTFIGTLNKHKGQDVLKFLLHITKNLGNKYEVNFYGRASKESMKSLSAYNINFNGSYEPNDLVEIMKKTDLGLVLPIWEDNAPQVVMEFLNYGIPVLGTKRGGIPDFIQHKVNGYLFDPNSNSEKNILRSWLYDLDMEKIKQMKNNIKKLKTPLEHSIEIEECYKTVLCK